MHKAVKNYDNSFHSTIGMTPEQATKADPEHLAKSAQEKKKN